MALSVLNRLQAARERLDAKDLAGAIAIYEEVLAEAGERADVLVTISGDLGSTGHVAEIVELIAPRYDAVRHGPATGLNLIQAYLAVHDLGSAQHVLDLLFSLNRPDLEERLFGFSNAIAELMLQPAGPGAPTVTDSSDGNPPQVTKVGIITVSRPPWSYGLEALLPRLLPPKEGRMRRIAFGQLALPEAYPDFDAAMNEPEDEMGRIARGLPAWLAEAFYFSAAYATDVAIPFVEKPGLTRRPMLYATEWTVENLRQLVDTLEENLDYAVTGALRHKAGDYEITLRVWELKKFRERKQFTARWTPATADAELAKLRDALGHYMEWSPPPPGAGISYTAPEPRPWIDASGASLNLFFAEKGLLPKDLLGPVETLTAELRRLAPTSAMASLAWLTAARRCHSLGLTIPAQSVTLFDSPIVNEAERMLADH